MNPVYQAAVAASLTSFQTFGWRVRVTGGHHLPRTGPWVLATNHVGYLDFVFAGYGVRKATRRLVRFVAKREVFDNPVVGPLMRSMGHIRVDRGGDTDAMMQTVNDTLAGGDIVGMFPEGTISPSFVPLAGRPGAARMAMDARVPLVPGAIWGSQRIFTKGRSFAPTYGAYVLIGYGSPIAYDPDEPALEVHGRLMAAIGDLVGELQARYPQRPRGEDDAWWLPAHLGGTAPTPEQAEARAAADRAKRAARRQNGE